MRASVCLVDELRFYLDFYLFGDENPSGFESLVPGEPKVFTIDFAGEAETHARHAPGIFARPLVFSLESDCLGGLADRKIPSYLDVCSAHAHVRALKDEMRVVFHVKEIS